MRRSRGCPTTSETGAPTAPSRSSAARRSPTTRGSAPGGSGRSSASSTPRCGRSAKQGYHGCSIDRITKLARCSRVSFYQYFASKEDVFRQLAGQVARQVSASTEALDPLTADVEGWAAMRAWVARYAEIHARYEPVFHALRERRRPRRRGPAHRRGDHRADPRAVGDDDAAAPAARPGDPAAPRVPEPHARRQRASSARSRPTRIRASASRSPSPMSCTARCSVCTPA